MTVQQMWVVVCILPLPRMRRNSADFAAAADVCRVQSAMPGMET